MTMLRVDNQGNEMKNTSHINIVYSRTWCNINRLSVSPTWSFQKYGSDVNCCNACQLWSRIKYRSRWCTTSVMAPANCKSIRNDCTCTGKVEKKCVSKRLEWITKQNTVKIWVAKYAASALWETKYTMYIRANVGQRARPLYFKQLTLSFLGDGVARYGA